ncbi:hypothetical protein LXL04_017785 [Taraxacum kok-saghyz]
MPPKRRGRPTRAGGAPPVFDPVAMEAIIAQRVTEALVAYELAHPGNGNGGGGGAGNPGGNGGNPRPCSYKDFMNYRPHNFAGTGGVIELTRWFEKTESVFQISNCTADSQVKFSACTFMHAALSWWNTHVQTIGIVQANALTWAELKTMMIEEYCPRTELQKLEQELWNLTMQGSNITGYTNRFNDLSVLCPAMVTPVAKKIERYIWGLSFEIQNSVTALNPLTYESFKNVAICMTDQAVRKGTMVPRAEPSREQHKRKPWNSNNSNNNSNNNTNNNRQMITQGPPKRQHTTTAYAAIPINAVAPQRQYGGNLPLCNKCNFHHTGACRDLFCTSCEKKGHTARYCRGTPVGSAPNINTGANRACYGCGDSGHFKKDCPKAAGAANGRVFALEAKEDMKQKGPAESHAPGNQVKYAYCTFANTALSWWNGHVQTIDITTANSMSWDELKTMMLGELRSESLHDMTHQAGNTVLRNGDPGRQEGRAIPVGLALQIQGMMRHSLPSWKGTMRSEEKGKLGSQNVDLSRSSIESVSPWKGTTHFGKRRKLNPRYIGPFEILAGIGPVTYKLKLPQELQNIHDTFHVSNLKKCWTDTTLIIPLEEIQVNEKLNFVEEPVEIMDREIERLKQSRIPIVKVRWSAKRGPEYTWGREDQMKQNVHTQDPRSLARSLEIPGFTSFKSREPSLLDNRFKIFIKQTLMNSPTFVLTLSKLMQSQRSGVASKGIVGAQFLKALAEPAQFKDIMSTDG